MSKLRSIVTAMNAVILDSKDLSNFHADLLHELATGD